MAEQRTRSEYRLAIGPDRAWQTVDGVTSLCSEDRDGLAQLMLDAYRGGVDDEGETFADACEAIDHYLTLCDPTYSFIVKADAMPVAMSLVLTVNDTYYIDPVAVTASRKGQGLGRRIVETSIAALVAAGVTELGATITDGNEPSERLFASLGATRVGPWPPARSD